MFTYQNKPTFFIEAKWLPSSEGGRCTLPKIGHYRPHICFIEDAERKMYAIGCQIVIDAMLDTFSYCGADFLSQIPPHVFTEPESSFWMFEGNKVVATGRVITRTEYLFQLGLLQNEKVG